jgi:hypothetical protein
MNTSIMKTLIAVLLGLTTSVSIAAESTPETTVEAQPEMSYALQKSMDPNVWIKLH